ncbi:hypothetical protein CCR94_16160 [Rhodoblastus sphagnicola]|uniref:Uncharacterized protein n=1 Tax=Rhodoblastus sphagnicola TaxID=333368 RepID=A0A2S6N3A4_9HYPH|nr:hypothetical protein [Rhodoblastus sphagnicola]MBB4197882.1 hypothetical protein [Rhodoblastus sphagnicola]PPQ29093.1 hypothetical protein CCR94_16160 [Rhodoblastus sphagnicola]
MSNNASPAKATALPDRRLFLAAGPAAAVMASLRKANAEESPLLALIAEYRRAKDAYGVACRADDEHPDLPRLLDEETAALEALCAHPVSSVEDVRAKSGALFAYVDYMAMPEDCYTALLRSFMA